MLVAFGKQILPVCYTSRLDTKVQKLPESSEERRNLLERVLERLPKLSPKLALTYQCRNLSELTDEDVASSLEDLQILGAIEALQEDDLE